MKINGTNRLAALQNLPYQHPVVDMTDPELLDRFVQLRDQSAFTALVRRHGGMVFGVCRRILGSSQDAEDAFQATFVVLASKAAGLKRPELLANWLYGVAYRTARKAKAEAARRGFHERQAALMAASETLPVGEDWQEVRALLDEELQHLPSKYRVPLVLCYLEGLTNEEAARRLGWPTGSISYRLARGRELLRGRLARRQRALPSSDFNAGLAAIVLPPAVPDSLIESTVQAAVGNAGQPNWTPALLALAAVSETAPAARTLRTLTVIAAGLVLTGLVAAGVYAFGFGPSGNNRSPSTSSSPGIPSTGCHSSPEGQTN